MGRPGPENDKARARSRASNMKEAVFAGDLPLWRLSLRTGDRPSGQFDYGRIVHWKADRPKRILGTCPNRVIDPVNAARFMTAASTSWSRARSAALNAPCAARPSRTGTPLGCLDIGSLPVQLRNPTATPNAPSGVDLTFPTHLAACPTSECQIAIDRYRPKPGLGNRESDQARAKQENAGNGQSEEAVRS